MSDDLQRCKFCDMTLAKCDWLKRQTPPDMCCFDCCH